MMKRMASLCAVVLSYALAFSACASAPPAPAAGAGPLVVASFTGDIEVEVNEQKIVFKAGSMVPTLPPDMSFRVRSGSAVVSGEPLTLRAESGAALRYAASRTSGTLRVELAVEDGSSPVLADLAGAVLTVPSDSSLRIEAPAAGPIVLTAHRGSFTLKTLQGRPSLSLQAGRRNCRVRRRLRQRQRLRRRRLRNMPRPLGRARYLATHMDAGELGPSSAEVAFVGRSNVGKSSLLNALCYQQKLARVSQTPGRTRSINVFEAGEGRWLVDLPGYGFAIGAKAERQKWSGMVEGYLKGRRNLSKILLVVDAEVGPTKLDLQMLEWLKEMQRPFRVVATKSDKVKPSRALTRRTELARAFGLHANDVYWVSSSKGYGLEDLRKDVSELLGVA